MPIKHLYFNQNTPTQQITYWGAIQGNIISQADLSSALSAKSDLNHEHNNLYEPKNSNIQNHIADNSIHLPALTNNSGKFLKTDGTSIFWQALPSFLSVINANLTLTVKTGVVDNQTTFNTLNDALNYLNDKWIMPNILVNIEIENGIFTNTSTITINHPCSERIRIYGKNVYSVNISNLNSYTGTSGSYSVVFTVNDVSNIEVGNYIQIKSPSTNLLIIRGCWKVTAVDTANKRITCFITTSRGNPTTGAMTCSITIIKTVLKFTATTGIEVLTPLIDLTKIVIEGALLTGANISGIYINKGLFTCGTVFGINNFEYGLRVYSGTAFTDGIMISGCRSGTLGYGLYLQNAVNLVSRSSYLTGNYYNCFATGLSKMDIKNSFALGGVYGIYSERLSTIDANGTTFDNTTNHSPLENTYGNIQAYINTL